MLLSLPSDQRGAICCDVIPLVDADLVSRRLLNTDKSIIDAEHGFLRITALYKYSLLYCILIFIYNFPVKADYHICCQVSKIFY